MLGSQDSRGAFVFQVPGIQKGRDEPAIVFDIWGGKLMVGKDSLPPKQVNKITGLLGELVIRTVQHVNFISWK